MTGIETQIEEMETLAARHFPDDETGRNACLARLLKERLRTLAYMLNPLPVKQMREE
jgi:hypothetical protein